MKTPQFEANGVEGMLDVVLGCTLIFLLLTAMVQVNPPRQQEMSLPPIQLSHTNKTIAPGVTSSNAVTLSIRADSEHGPQYWLNDEKISASALPARLRKLGSVAHLNLRRDPSLPCSLEDQVILACHEAGISQIAIIIQKEK
ncbi:MAG: hypothetical protein D6820_11460 [Lentisphaerae bacterium]|nr:MAG: hypothetical protein D6820_11460 [Lentisphaerota bacterium]